MVLLGNAWEHGYCINEKGGRPRRYETLLQSTMEDCEEFCRAEPGVTGCEYSTVSAVACKAHKEAPIMTSNVGLNGFFCLLFKQKGK